VDWEIERLEVNSEAHAKEIAIALNANRREELTTDQRRDMIRLIKSLRGWKQYRPKKGGHLGIFAKLLGVSTSTVSRDIDVIEAEKTKHADKIEALRGEKARLNTVKTAVTYVTGKEVKLSVELSSVDEVVVNRYFAAVLSEIPKRRSEIDFELERIERDGEEGTDGPPDEAGPASSTAGDKTINGDLETEDSPENSTSENEPSEAGPGEAEGEGDASDLASEEGESESSTEDAAPASGESDEKTEEGVGDGREGQGDNSDDMADGEASKSDGDVGPDVDQEDEKNDAGKTQRPALRKGDRVLISFASSGYQLAVVAATPQSPSTSTVKVIKNVVARNIRQGPTRIQKYKVLKVAERDVDLPQIGSPIPSGEFKLLKRLAERHRAEKASK
jgi:hypothetical protein